MMDYKEEDLLLLSGIQHYKFCKRQWAIIHIEQQWNENYLTASGRLIHENVHNPELVEKRKNRIISRAMPIYSYNLGVSGECDAVEFILDDNGIQIKGREGKYRIYPIEYKRGKPKDGDEDISQLVAQIICLEDMFCTTINSGCLYYDTIKRRVEVEITNDMKDDVRKTFEEMHRLYYNRHTPKVKTSSKCKACSVKDICLPILCSKQSASEYIKNILN